MAEKKNTGKISEKRINARNESDLAGLIAVYGKDGTKQGNKAAAKNTKKKSK